MKKDDYPRRLKEEYEKQYAIAVKARSKGLDVSLRVESESTYDLAERVEKSVGPKGVAERIRELSKVISREETALSDRFSQYREYCRTTGRLLPKLRFHRQ